LFLSLERHPDDYTVSKQRVGAFIGTSLDEILRKRSVTQVFVTGIATTLGVESTARSAYDYGYNVVTVVDAMTDRDAEAHRHSVEKIFPRISETDTTDNVLKLLKKGTRLLSAKGAVLVPAFLGLRKSSAYQHARPCGDD